jgi:hypothetical protein
MAEIRIPVENLPAPDKNGDHAFQFRVISVDKNQWSAWSQLYIIKSIGQYRPLESNVAAVVSAEDISLTWDTPTIYNYNSASLTSASIAHNHSQRFKQHDTDVYVQWGSGSVMGNFEYHDRVSSDNTSIAMNIGSTSLRVIGIVALKDIPRQDLFEEDEDFNTRIEEYLGLSGSAQGVYDLFKIFDTGVFSLFE